MIVGFIYYPARRVGLIIGSLYCVCMLAIVISAVIASADAPHIASMLDTVGIIDLIAKIVMTAGIPFVFCRSSNTRKEGVKSEATEFWSDLMACNRIYRLHIIIKQPCISLCCAKVRLCHIESLGGVFSSLQGTEEI